LFGGVADLEEEYLLNGNRFAFFVFSLALRMSSCRLGNKKSGTKKFRKTVKISKIYKFSKSFIWMSLVRKFTCYKPCKAPEMRTILLLFIHFFSLQAQAQVPKTNSNSPFDFRSDPAQSKYVSFNRDTTELKINTHYNRILDSAYKLDKNYDFEFRLWKRYLSNNFDNVFIMRLRNNQWTASYYDRNNGIIDRIIFTERPVDQSRLNQLWELLVQNNVLTLPDQRALNERMVTYVVDTTNPQYGRIKKVNITDGILYCFELSTPTKKRFYSYGNPQVYLKHYGNIEELYNAVVIILLIEKFLG
jgi:hypothetical protein